MPSFSRIWWLPFTRTTFQPFFCMSFSRSLSRIFQFPPHQ
nr:MAG TPA: hypothetical protein [Caudoviricetes sp.]